VDGRVASSDVVDGNVMPKHVQEAKSPVKTSSDSVARRDLIPALNG
jgi:hypothetical protein